MATTRPATAKMIFQNLPPPAGRFAGAYAGEEMRIRTNPDDRNIQWTSKLRCSTLNTENTQLGGPKCLSK